MLTPVKLKEMYLPSSMRSVAKICDRFHFDWLPELSILPGFGLGRRKKWNFKKGTEIGK